MIGKKAALVCILLCGCTNLKPVKYSATHRLDDVLELNVLTWEIPKPIKPTVDIRGNEVILSSEDFVKLLDLYKYSKARELDVYKLLDLNNAVISERNDILDVARLYESNLNESRLALHNERDSRIEEQKYNSLQLNATRALLVLVLIVAI